jgi:hypothetical protein
MAVASSSSVCLSRRARSIDFLATRSRTARACPLKSINTSPEQLSLPSCSDHYTRSVLGGLGASGEISCRRSGIDQRRLHPLSRLRGSQALSPMHRRGAMERSLGIQAQRCRAIDHGANAKHGVRSSSLQSIVARNAHRKLAEEQHATISAVVRFNSRPTRSTFNLSGRLTKRLTHFPNRVNPFVSASSPPQTSIHQRCDLPLRRCSGAAAWARVQCFLFLRLTAASLRRASKTWALTRASWRV